MSETLLSFVHITDTHISADPHYNQDGAMHTPLVGAKALVRQINMLPFAPDFVLHTGDVAYNPDETAYPVAYEILSALKYPVYYLAGNHDDPAILQRIMLHSKAQAVKTPFDYQFDVNGVQIVALDSNRKAQNWCGRVSDEQLAWLEAITRAKDNRPLIVTLHHPPLPMGSVFWDDWMRLENGEAFHKALLPARDRLRGVFSGHVHQNTDITRDGITYFTAKSSWYQIYNYPHQEKPEPDRFADPGYSIVVVTRDQTYVRRCTFRVDPGSRMD
jgi:3',5'-cyclic-AMP phosphodiesterase